MFRSHKRTRGWHHNKSTWPCGARHNLRPGTTQHYTYTQSPVTPIPAAPKPADYPILPTSPTAFHPSPCPTIVAPPLLLLFPRLILESFLGRPCCSAMFTTLQLACFVCFEAPRAPYVRRCFSVLPSCSAGPPLSLPLLVFSPSTTTTALIMPSLDGTLSA